MRQLPLGVQLGLALRFETFHAVPANSEAVAALRRLAEASAGGPIWLFGPAGAGKSHLLQAACAHAGAYGRTAAYLPLAQLRDESAAMLDGYERPDLVALDDIEAVTGNAAWERALFNLHNGVTERGGGLVCAALRAPAGTGIGLADLASRLGACEAHRLHPLAEPEQAEALRRRARHRGLDLPEDTVAFLTRRAPREFASLCRMLDELDAESLAAQRRLTIPFVREWLARSEGRPGARG